MADAMMMLRERVGAILDTMVRPTMWLLNKPRSAFQVCGYTGLAFAIGLAMTLIAYQGLPLWVMVAVILSAMATFLALAMITKIIIGEEQLVYYHHEVAVMILAALVLWLLGQPLLPYLDATILGVGTFLAFGRVGCLIVGCCHGKPHAWGVCYREEHAAAGFAPYLVGARLFPIQAVESLWVLGVVVVGSAFVLNGTAPGEALAWYVVMYDIGRFSFEFVRGDPARPYHLGFSEAQWISLILLLAVAAAEGYGLLPYHVWHTVAVVVMGGTMVAVAFHRRRRAAVYRLLHARHIREVAEAINLVLPTTGRAKEARGTLGPTTIPLVCTSLGIRISADTGGITDEELDHYTFSQDDAMTPEVAATLADLILQLKHPTDAGELAEGAGGTFHLLVRRNGVYV